MWRLSSAMISSFHNSMYPLEREINPPKTTCMCPCGGVLKTNKQRKQANENKNKNNNNNNNKKKKKKPNQNKNNKQTNKTHQNSNNSNSKQISTQTNKQTSRQRTVTTTKSLVEEGRLSINDDRSEMKVSRSVIGTDRGSSVS